MSPVESAEPAVSGASTAASPTPSASPSKPKPKKPTPVPGTYSVVPLQEKAIQYVTFMLRAEGVELSPEQFVQEAVARQLSYVQKKQGIEYPPGLQASLQQQELMK